MTSMIDIVAQDKRTPGIKHIEPLLHPLLPELYANRAARLRQLAEGHEQASYLRFAAQVVDALPQTLTQVQANPWSGDLNIANQTEASLTADDALWTALPLVLDSLGTIASPQAETAVASLRGQSRQALASQALRLLRGDIHAEEASQAVFLWAALSLVWASRANPALQPDGDQAPHEHSHAHDQTHAHGDHALCPICGCTPTGSLILTGDRAGLRYLQCSLCETRWHMVRAKCSNCGSAAELDYWSFDPAEQPDLPGGSAIKAESCGDCGGYLKAAYLEKDPAAEIVADDLASLALDAAVAQEGFRRTGFNPFAFPAN